jgi:pimeloyl-ACP methyl ester carboxylesterase
LNYVRQGRGTPPLVFVHGFACDHTDWQFQLEELKKTHEVVACDLRGHGATPGRPHECTIEHYGGDVLALINNLELPAAILVGHSMGCRVVLEAARIAPERIAALVLIDGSRQGSGEPAQAEALTRSAILAAGYPVFAENVFRQMFFEWSPLAEAALARMKRMPAETGIALWTRMVRWDATELEAALAALRAPLMVIQSTWINAERKRLPLREGESSPWLDLLRAKASRIEVIPGVGHFPQLEAPQRVNQLIAEFAAARR